MTNKKATYEELADRIKELEGELAEHKNTSTNSNSVFEKSKDHQTIPAFTVVIGSDGRLVDMNISMLDALGYTMDEVLGENYLAKFVPAPERDMLQEVFDELAVSNNATINNNHILTKNGELLLVEWHGTSVFKPDEETAFIIGIGVEVAEWKLSRERCEKLLTKMCGV